MEKHVNLILGTAQLGSKYGLQEGSLFQNNEEIVKVLQCCIDNGVTSIDTAIGYGESEAIIGNFKYNGFKIFTKIPRIPPDVDDDYSYCMRLYQQSLSRLNVSCLEGVLLHFSQDIHSKGVRLFLNEIKRQKLTNNIGLSIYDPNELEKCGEHLNIDLIQAPVNVFDRRILNNSTFRKLKSNGVKLQARSIFLQGLLTAPISKLDEWFMKWNLLLERWERTCKSDRATKIKTCMNSVLYETVINSVVIGFDSAAQCKEVIDIYKNHAKFEMTCFSCTDQNLINPSHWKLNRPISPISSTKR